MTTQACQVSSHGMLPAIVLASLLVTISWQEPQAEPAKIMRATIYDDGLACPGNCDAHVVFASRHNGTRNAFRPPLTNRAAPERCSIGKLCMICFDENDSSCFTALYRGNGPHEQAFDFTPAFFSSSCGKPVLPPQFAAKCRELEAEVHRLGYDQRVNCFSSASDRACAALLQEAERLKTEDAVEREACLREGQSTYNARQSDRKRQRSLECNYERFGTGGPNSKGKTWRRLLPGACRDGTFVGRDGLDCCSNDLFAAAALHPECSIFFPHHRQ